MSELGSSTTKLVTIRSKDLKAKTFYLPRAMFVRGVRVESMFFPYSFHNVNSKQNKVYLRQRFLTGETFVEVAGTVTVPDGNYNASQFATALQTALNTAGVGGWAGTWTVSVGETTARLTIHNNTREFIVETGPQSLNELIGFTTLSTVYGQTKVGNDIINMAPIRVINLRSVGLGNLLEDCIYSGNTMDNSVLASVWLTTPFGSYAEHRPHQSTWMQLGRGQPIRLDGFDLDLCDEDLNPIDFLGQDWYVQLSFI